MWANKEEQLKLIGASAPKVLKTYKAPSGLFDQAATGTLGPMPVMEVEDSWLRMEVFRKAIAGLVGQHIFLCICAIAGFQMHQLHLPIPAYVVLICVGVATVVYFVLWLKSTRYPMNFYFFILFTLCLGLFIVDSVTTHEAQEPADMMFMLTLALVLMLLYSLPSFCCDLAIFDIKSAGLVGYIICVCLAAVVGLGAAMKTHPTNPAHGMVPVVVGGVWMLGQLLSMYRALEFFREGHIMPIIISAWVFPMDWFYKGTQAGCRKFQAVFDRSFWSYIGLR